MSTLAFASAVAFHGADAAGTKLNANPIRRVVNMLQSMVKKVEAEGEAEQKIFEEYMCFCKSGGGELEKTIAAAEEKIPQLEAGIKEGEGASSQLGSATEQAKKDREAAKQAVAEATALREQEADAFASQSAEMNANIEAMGKAIAALEAGSGASFLQSASASALKKIAALEDVDAGDRDSITAFLALQDEDQISSQSGEIIGILKQLKETMESDLAEATSNEDKAKGDYDALVAAKTKEIESLTASIEGKLTRNGEAGVNLEDMKQDLKDTQKALAKDKLFLKDLDKNCAEQKAEWEARTKVRGEEILALQDTIKLLNSDDALELFKKTLPSGSSFLQLASTATEMKQQALVALGDNKHHDVRLDLVSLALKGKKVSFDKVVGMITEMIGILNEEQASDSKKKSYCESEIDKTEDALKSTQRKVADLGKAADENKGAIAAVTDEIAAMEVGVKKLDQMVADATAERKEAHQEHMDTLAGNQAAMELLGMAKTRLNKFYNPKLAFVQKPAQTEDAPSFVQVSEHRQADSDSQEPAKLGKFEKKSEESNGVLAMIDTLAADLEKENTIMETEEKNAQEEYEAFMKDSSAKRLSDMKVIEEKMGAKADMEGQAESISEETRSAQNSEMSIAETLGGLHKDCDWLLQNFDVRKEARTDEIEALNKAKAVLSGADYSFLQTSQTRRLRGKAVAAPEDQLAAEMTHDLEMNFNKIAPFGKEDTAKELQDHAAKTQDTLVDAVENAEVAEIKRAVFRALTRLRAATIKEFDTIARLETQAIDAYNDAHHYRAENPLAHLHEDEAPVETDKLKSFH